MQSARALPIALTRRISNCELTGPYCQGHELMNLFPKVLVLMIVLECDLQHTENTSKFGQGSLTMGVKQTVITVKPETTPP